MGLERVEWVRAHSIAKQMKAMSPHLKCTAHGNDDADELAKLGAMRAPFSSEVVAVDEE